MKILVASIIALIFIFLVGCDATDETVVHQINDSCMRILLPKKAFSCLLFLLVS
jgi:hypothetical protein